MSSSMSSAEITPRSTRSSASRKRAWRRRLATLTGQVHVDPHRPQAGAAQQGQHRFHRGLAGQLALGDLDHGTQVGGPEEVGGGEAVGMRPVASAMRRMGMLEVLEASRVSGDRWGARSA